MSHSAEYEWQQRQAARREQHLNRIREVTAQFITRYETVLGNLRSAGLDAAIPVEFSVIEGKVADLRSMLSTNPELARESSMSIGSEVNSLPHLARAARSHAQAEAVRRQQHLGQEMQALLDRTFAKILDPVVRDFAYTAASGMHDEIAARVISGAALDQFSKELPGRLEEVVADAAVQAVQWKASQGAALRGAVRADVLADATSAALAGASGIPHEARIELESALNAIGTDDSAAFAAKLASALDRADKIVVDEESRRTAVRAVYESLQQAGFSVAAPYLEGNSGENVVISARKPSGGEAEFRISAAGGLLCKFDHYEGSTCKVDINQVMPMLEQIYGISLSNERILWENPDRLSRDARPLDDKEAKR